MRTRTAWPARSVKRVLRKRCAPTAQSSTTSLSSSHRRKPSSPSTPISCSPLSAATSSPCQRAENCSSRVSPGGGPASGGPGQSCSTRVSTVRLAKRSKLMPSKYSSARPGWPSGVRSCEAGTLGAGGGSAWNIGRVIGCTRKAGPNM
jgi:hypothetical protein